jgi:hypothetical protein
MIYNIENIEGTVITIPPITLLDYKGITLVGRDTVNWNSPFQENFVKLIDRIAVLEAKLGIVN